jgi:hypothetical protein
MTTYGGVDVYIHVFLLSAIDGVEWPFSHPCPFTPRERAPFTTWIGGWVDPRAILEILDPITTARVFRSDSPGEAGQWLARSIRES